MKVNPHTVIVTSSTYSYFDRGSFIIIWWRLIQLSRLQIWRTVVFNVYMLYSNAIKIQADLLLLFNGNCFRRYDLSVDIKGLSQYSVRSIYLTTWLLWVFSQYMPHTIAFNRQTLFYNLIKSILTTQMVFVQKHFVPWPLHWSDTCCGTCSPFHSCLSVGQSGGQDKDLIVRLSVWRPGSIPNIYTMCVVPSQRPVSCYFWNIVLSGDTTLSLQL